MKLTRPEEECGIFGIYNHPEAANLTYLGLYALQHRGQESCGIVSSDGSSLHYHKNMGLVALLLQLLDGAEVCALLCKQLRARVARRQAVDRGVHYKGAVSAKGLPRRQVMTHASP